MFGLGMPELMIILVILMVIAGPRKLPQLGSALGGAIRGFKKAAEGEPAGIDAEHKKNQGPDP
ncbi:MAG: twin-arginine translocase TatA/TatE family subunit [Deltaproteobacteria bacterium]|nr:twin-arginine translocase TatA/TatE family subunit [Deltaproteobacteria bacterium]